MRLKFLTPRSARKSDTLRATALRPADTTEAMEATGAATVVDMVDARLTRTASRAEELVT